MRRLALVIIAVIGSIIAYGHYNGLQAKKYREYKRELLFKTDNNHYWPHGEGPKIVAYPKQVQQKTKDNSFGGHESFENQIKLVYKQLQNVLVNGYDIACSLVNKIDIKTAGYSNSPFIDLFPKPKNPVVDNKKVVETRPIAKKPKVIVRNNAKPNRTVTPEPPYYKTVPIKTVPIETVRFETVRASMPVPIVNDNQQIEIRDMSAPSVPRANFDYAVVNYSR